MPMENKYLFLMTAALITLFVYFTAMNILDNRSSCQQENDCTLAETSCCSGEKTYACFENKYALLFKTQNLKCPFISNGTCSAKYKAPPDCVCVQKQCATREKNETEFKEQLKNISNFSRSTEQNEWGK